MKLVQSKAAKKQHLINRAARLRRVNAKALDTAQEMASAIASVEPILSSHHSEARDRRYRRRLHDTLTHASLENAATHRLDAREDFSIHGITGNDPEALPKLRVVLEQLSLARHTMKSANVCVRSNDRDGLRKLLFSEPEIDRLLQPDFTGYRGFSPMLLTHIKADIARATQRIGDLENARYRHEAQRIQPSVSQGEQSADIIAA